VPLTYSMRITTAHCHLGTTRFGSVIVMRQPMLTMLSPVLKTYRKWIAMLMQIYSMGVKRLAAQTRRFAILLDENVLQIDTNHVQQEQRPCLQLRYA